MIPVAVSCQAISGPHAKGKKSDHVFKRLLFCSPWIFTIILLFSNTALKYYINVESKMSASLASSSYFVLACPAVFIFFDLVIPPLQSELISNMK